MVSEIKEGEEEYRKMSIENWLRERPFTTEEVEGFNRYTYFPGDINEEFNKVISDKEEEIREKLKRYGVAEFSARLKTAMYYYRRACYLYYLDKIRARSVAPSPLVVGFTNYKGNIGRAERIEAQARERIETAEKYLARAVSDMIKGNLPCDTIVSKIKIDELKGARLKKDLGLDRAIKRYHNKHVDGSGNFGFTLIKNGKWYTLDGDYTRDGFVYHLHFGAFSSTSSKVEIENYEELLEKIKSELTYPNIPQQI